MTIMRIIGSEIHLFMSELVYARGVASPYTCRPWRTKFLFDHSNACNKLGVVGVS